MDDPSLLFAARAVAQQENILINKAALLVADALGFPIPPGTYLSDHYKGWHQAYDWANKNKINAKAISGPNWRFICKVIKAKYS